MAMNRKYSALPDLDTAPDVYETPELTDDNSTLPATTVRSENESTDDEDDDDNIETGISRSHVHIDQARSRFLGAEVDARDVNFSDRVDVKRKSYRTTARRRRMVDGVEMLGDLTEEDGDDDNEDDDDNNNSGGRIGNLERKIARLKREVEEAKQAYAKKKQAAEAAGTSFAVGGGTDKDMASLSEALDEITRLTRAVPTTETVAVTTAAPTAEATAAAIVPPANLAKTDGSLAQVADFDRRLVLLERSIGIGSSVLLDFDGGFGSGHGSGGGGGGNGLPKAILPTLDSLHRQISTLSEASTASLDGISRRVRALTQEADQLTKARLTAKAAQEALAQANGGGVTATAATGSPSKMANTVRSGANNDGTGGAAAAAAGADADQTTKINALYGILPTIESLTPLLPPLLDRLRSLRVIHADAAVASELLEELEQRQADMAGEIKQWREGLDSIEAAMKDGEKTMGKNMKVMDGWVKDLETRLSRSAS